MTAHHNINIKQIFIFFILFCNLLQAKEYKDIITDFEVVKVRDGDTFVINISNIPDVFGSEIAVRIRGIDTPEKNDSRENIKKIALEAHRELEKLLLSAKNIELYDLGRDKYFRLLASVKADGVDVGQYLIRKGLAKKYNGGKKQW